MSSFSQRGAIVRILVPLLVLAAAIPFIRMGMSSANGYASVPPALLAATGPVAGESYVWRPVAIGGGGFITGLDFSTDGKVRLARADVHGAYRWDDKADRWVQLVTAASMPEEDRAPGRANEGVHELAIAPSAPARLYMALKGRIYRSDDGGAHWRRPGAAEFRFDAAAEGRFAGPFLAVHPANPDLLFFATAQNGVWRSTDGAQSWERVPGLPQAAPAALPGPIVHYARTPGGKGYALFVGVPGHGLLRSGDDGRSFTALDPRSMHAPRSVWRMAALPDGRVLAVDRDGSNAALFADGRWVSLVGDERIPARRFLGVAAGADGKRLVVIDEGGHGWCSADGGAQWSAMSASAAPGEKEPPWLRVADKSYFATGSIAFDPAKPDRLWNAAGTGPWYADLGEGCGALEWRSQVRGIEELVAMDVVQPPGHAPVFAALDFGIHVKADLNSFSTTYGPAERVLIAAQQLAWSPANPAFLATNASDTRTECCSDDGLSVMAGYSHDGGRNWRLFDFLPTPPGTKASDPWRMAFGTIAVAADDTGNIVWQPGYNRSPFYTRTRGLTWSRVVLPGEVLPDTGSFPRIWPQRKTLAADRVLPATFYWMHSGEGRNARLAGLWRSKDGGERWEQVHVGAIAPESGHAAKLRAVPGQAGHLFFTTGLLGGRDTRLRRSRDGGENWQTLDRLTAVDDIAFGKAAAGGRYPAIYLSGRVDGVYGLWRSVDDGASWQRLVDFPLGRLDQVTVLEADKDVFGRIYIGYMGSGWIYGEPGRCGEAAPSSGDVQCRAVDPPAAAASNRDG